MRRAAGHFQIQTAWLSWYKSKPTLLLSSGRERETPPVLYLYATGAALRTGTSRKGARTTGKKTNLKLMYRFPWKKLWLVIEKKSLGSRASSDVLIQRRYCLNKESHIEKYSFIGFNVSFYVCGFYVLSSVTMWRTKFFESWICRQCCICGVLVTGM